MSVEIVRYTKGVLHLEDGRNVTIRVGVTSDDRLVLIRGVAVWRHRPSLEGPLHPHCSNEAPEVRVLGGDPLSVQILYGDPPEST
jgi:hypothetical protein